MWSVREEKVKCWWAMVEVAGLRKSWCSEVDRQVKEM